MRCHLLSQAGVEKLGNLKVLYMSNNKIKDWVEIDRLAALGKLEDLLLVGNPLYNDFRDNNATADYRIEVCVGREEGQEGGGVVIGECFG
jgi:dynein light chain 1